MADQLNDVDSSSITSESGVDQALNGIRNAMRKLDEQSGNDDRSSVYSNASLKHEELSMNNWQPLTSSLSQARLTPSYVSRKPEPSPRLSPSKRTGLSMITNKDDLNKWLLPLKTQDEDVHKESLKAAAPTSAPTKACLTALRAMQARVKRLEEEKQEVARRCQELKIRIKAVEANSKAKIDNGILKAKGWTAAQAQLFKRLSENSAGIEKELACMSEEKKSLLEHVEKAKEQVVELETSRRSLEARATAHRDRNARLSGQLKEAESKASEQLMTAMSMEASNAERARVLQAKLTASDVLRDTISGEVEELELELSSAEEMLNSVMVLTSQVKRINAESNRKPPVSGGFDPHYSINTTSSKAPRTCKVHPCVRLPCRSCR